MLAPLQSLANTHSVIQSFIQRAPRASFIFYSREFIFIPFFFIINNTFGRITMKCKFNKPLRVFACATTIAHWGFAHELVYWERFSCRVWVFDDNSISSYEIGESVARMRYAWKRLTVKLKWFIIVAHAFWLMADLLICCKWGNHWLQMRERPWKSEPSKAAWFIDSRGFSCSIVLFVESKKNQCVLFCRLDPFFSPLPDESIYEGVEGVEDRFELLFRLLFYYSCISTSS